MKKNVFLSFISIVLTLFLIEIVLSFFIKNQDINFQRYLLYDEGKVFKNINDKIFKFHPNKEILTENFYRINDIFFKESSYILKTNNFGLVQSNNIDKEIPSILFYEKYLDYYDFCSGIGLKNKYKSQKINIPTHST